jgi:hypothetical protein
MIYNKILHELSKTIFINSVEEFMPGTKQSADGIFIKPDPFGIDHSSVGLRRNL